MSNERINRFRLLDFVFAEAAQFRKQALAVQRSMPRPSDVNTTVLRPPEMQVGLNPYQEVSF